MTNQELRDRAERQAEQAAKRAKSSLVHYFKLAIPNMSADMVGEVESIADDIVETAVARAQLAVWDTVLEAMGTPPAEASPAG